MTRSERTQIHFLVWYVTAKQRPEMERLRSELVKDFAEYFRRSRFFSAAKFAAISFNVYFSDEIREQIKLGRIRKSLNALWVDIVFDSSKWEDLTKQEMKDHLMLNMAKAVVMAGDRYMLPIGPFDRLVSKLHHKLGGRIESVFPKSG